MDIRTKLVFALVALALGSMLALGGFMYMSADEKLDELTRSRLRAIGESSEAAIDEVLKGWRERVQLIASRTQLRLSLNEYERSGNPRELSLIDRILDDAFKSGASIHSLGVYGADGALVASVGEPLEAGVPAAAGSGLSAAGSGLPARTGGERTPPNGAGSGNGQPVETRFLSAMVDDEGRLRVALAADLVLDGERLGELVVLLTGRELIMLTEDFPGLGETGEILIVMRDDAGIRTLNPVLDPATGERRTVQIAGGDSPVVRALNKEEDVFEGGFTNYRGISVWAATRYIDETEWGVVVTFDDAEVQRSISEFRTETITLALSLSGIAILFAVLLGFRFATPMHHLADVANRIRGGEMDARATVKREDEIGMLARDFNAMANELETRMTELYKFHRFFEVSLDMLCIAGTDGYFKRVNPAFERTLGWSTEELLERPFLDLVHPDDVAATTKEIEKLAQGIPTISFENRFRCANGTFRRLRWTSHPEPDGTLYAVAREMPDAPDTA